MNISEKLAQLAKKTTPQEFGAWLLEAAARGRNLGSGPWATYVRECITSEFENFNGGGLHELSMKEDHFPKWYEREDYMEKATTVLQQNRGRAKYGLTRLDFRPIIFRIDDSFGRYYLDLEA